MGLFASWGWAFCPACEVTASLNLVTSKSNIDMEKCLVDFVTNITVMHCTVKLFGAIVLINPSLSL